MAALDWVALGGYFVVMLLIGLWSHKRISNVSDYFTGGGRMPWWLSGISHHMSGYSAAVFVAYAAVAYSYGITVYVWAFIPLAVGTGLGAVVFAPAGTGSASGTGSPRPSNTSPPGTTCPPSRPSPGAAPCSRSSTWRPSGPRWRSCSTCSPA